MEKDQQKSVQWYSYQDDYSGAGDKVGKKCWFRNKILKCWNAKSEKETEHMYARVLILPPNNDIQIDIYIGKQAGEDYIVKKSREWE